MHSQIEHMPEFKLDFMLSEWYYTTKHFILPLVIFFLGLWLVQQSNEGENMLMFTMGMVLGLLATIYLIVFLVQRMIHTFKSRHILDKQKEIMRHSKPWMFILFLAICSVLIFTVSFFGEESWVFKGVLWLLDIGIWVTIYMSVREKHPS